MSGRGQHVISVATFLLRFFTGALAGAAVGWALNRPVLAVAGAVLGAVVGAIHGRCLVAAAVYPPTPRGWWLLVVDHTWSLVNTTVGALFLTYNLAKRNEVVADASAGRTSLILRRGVIPGFATTLGPVEAGSRPHIRPHEYVHVFQARIFGPVYFPLVGLHYVIVTMLPYWWLYHDHRGHPIRSVSDYFMKGVYPHVWNEEWAYRVAGNPP